MLTPRQALIRQLQSSTPFASIADCREAQLSLGRVLLYLAYDNAWDTVLTRSLLRSIGADYGLHWHCGVRVCSVGDFVGPDGLVKAHIRQLLTE